ncbi:MAG: sulfocyanin-like copper-binding protein [Gaiellaceae bacterium]
MAGLTLAALLAGCGGGHPPSSSARPVKPKPPLDRFLSVDAAHHAVDLTLIAGDGSANNGFNFDGYGRGELVVHVPVGWKVTVHCKNDGTLPNSCAVVSGPGATGPAFPGATTPNPVAGFASGRSATFRFTASRVGSYRLASLVTGHERARMWDLLEVTQGGRPSIGAR